jgi:transcription elongation factor GreB
MSRYRPPTPKSSAYITVEGAARLRAELHQLWVVERPQVTTAVHEAAKNGDRSENGDYIYGKRRLREIDSRVRYLTKRLEDVTVVDRIPEQQDKVFFGAWITVEYENGAQQVYRIVGADEIQPAEGWISVDSPLARAALGKTLEDEISFRSLDDKHTAWIVAIRYQ